MAREKLSESERTLFTKIKARLDDGFSKMFEMAEDMRYVRERRLYREDYDTFDHFVRQYFGYTVAYVNRLIIADTVKKELDQSNIDISTSDIHQDASNPTPMEKPIAPIGAILKTESQARELAKAEPGTRAEVLKNVVASGPVTAKTIAAEVSKRKTPPPPAKPTPVYDKVGREITEEALPWWNRTPEVTGLIELISQLRVAVNAAFEDKDAMYFGECNNATLISSLNSAYADMKRARPYAVCPYCQGHPKQTKCTFCFTKGLVSQFRWETAVPKELKDMIAKQVEQEKRK